MLNVNNLNNILYKNNTVHSPLKRNDKTFSAKGMSVPLDFRSPSSENLKAYIPSFSAVRNNKQLTQSEKAQFIASKLDKTSLEKFNILNQRGILLNNASNDGSTVLDNMYKIVTEPRLRGLSDKLILSEIINSLENPASITQKFGDIPDNVSSQIEKETGVPFPQNAKNVSSSSCVVTSMEYNMASKTPAEFVRFAQGLSSPNYSVDKKIRMSALSDSLTQGLWFLREFNTDCSIAQNWEDVSIKIKPDRNAIVRARVQSSYKDPNERSCVDVLIQSALLNLGSQHSYDSITDERTGKFNPEKTGLTDLEKNFVEQIVFEKQKILVTYQNIDETGKLAGYNCDLNEMKQHLLKSLDMGENVIVGYTHMDKDKNILGGHEITITGYRQDSNGRGIFICNDTDDNVDSLIEIAEDELLPTIHHAGISKEALSPTDEIDVPWRTILASYQEMLKEEQNQSI